MSVPRNTLTDEYRAELLAFYGSMFGWSEIESMRLPDRLILAVGRGTYVNIRERDDAMTCHGYEHFGLLVSSPEDAETAWHTLDQDARDVHLEPLDRGDDGYRSFRFRYMLPLAVEVQYLPESRFSAR